MTCPLAITPSSDTYSDTLLLLLIKRGLFEYCDDDDAVVVVVLVGVLPRVLFGFWTGLLLSRGSCRRMGVRSPNGLQSGKGFRVWGFMVRDFESSFVHDKSLVVLAALRSEI